MYRSMKGFLLLALFVLLNQSLLAQGAQKTFNPIYEDYFDSLKNMDYPYTFPFLGIE